MGERYDVVVSLGDGVFPLTALAEGKNSTALALISTGHGHPTGAGLSCHPVFYSPRDGPPYALEAHRRLERLLSQAARRDVQTAADRRHGPL